MTEWIVLSLALVGMVSVFTIGTIWSRRETWIRLAAVVGFVLIIPYVAVVTASSLGFPRPYIPEITIPAGDHDVLGGKIVRDEGIYVLFALQGHIKPRYYALPWDKDTANKFQRMMEKHRGGFRARVPKYKGPWWQKFFKKTPQFHPPPVPPVMPDKREQTPGRAYERGT